MKKIGINLIIGTILSIILIVISLLVIKPNMTYLVGFNGNIYSSKNPDTFSYENEIISYKKTDILRINYIITDKDTLKETTNTIAYNEETGKTVMACDKEMFEVIITKTVSNDNQVSYSPSFDSTVTQEQMAICLKYITLLDVKSVDNDRINVGGQKTICSILSIFIGYILSFLAYPVILFDKIKENKKLAILSSSMTLILCISSAIYIFFTLK